MKDLAYMHPLLGLLAYDAERGESSANNEGRRAWSNNLRAERCNRREDAPRLHVATIPGGYDRRRNHLKITRRLNISVCY